MNIRPSFIVILFSVALVAALAAVILTLAVIDRRTAAPAASLPTPRLPTAVIAPKAADWVTNLNELSTAEAKSGGNRHERQQDYELCKVKRKAGEAVSCIPPFP